MLNLEVSGVDLHYGAAQALRGLSLNAEEGQITCVLGRNGVGKTSLLRAITGHQRISDGDIRVDGASLGSLKSYAAPHKASPMCLRQGDLSSAQRT